MCRPLYQNDLDDIRRWWNENSPCLTFMEPPTEAWWDYVSVRDNAFAFCSVGPVSGRVTVYSQVDLEISNGRNRVASVAMMTAPDLHRCGWGTRHWDELSRALKEMTVDIVQATIEKKNEISQNFFRNLGFSPSHQPVADPRLLNFELEIGRRKRAIVPSAPYDNLRLVRRISHRRKSRMSLRSHPHSL